MRRALPPVHFCNISARYDAWTSSWSDYHYGTGAGGYVRSPGSGFTCGGMRLVFDQPLVDASSYGDINSYNNGFVLGDSALKNFQQASITSIAQDGATPQVAADASTLVFYLFPTRVQLNVTWVRSDTPPAVPRYVWADHPVMKLYSAHGMPAPPFALELSS